MDRRTELTAFLRSRRARLDPDQVGVPVYGGRPRRVPGLRREELAALAGVSVDYYVRLEQGRAVNVSEAVLDAVARALRLDHDEREHLRRLARPSRETTRRPPVPQKVRPELRHLVEAITDAAAYVIGRRTDVLAWNQLGAALITDLSAMPQSRRNFARIMFADEGLQSLFDDWPAKARDIVAYLRFDAGRHPGDATLAALVGDLSVASGLFRRLWADHPVASKGHAAVLMNHPIAGRLELSYQTLSPLDDPDQMLVTYSAEPGSASAAALRALASWHAV
jgi:transcriptional regulator with XRE-family HTH domain